MKGRALVLPIISALMLVILALLQFGWLGQVSQAQKQQHQRFLEKSVESFSLEVDQELTRVFNFFVVGVLEKKNRQKPLALRYRAWQEQAPFPRIVKGVFLVGTDEDDWLLEQLKPDGTWDVLDWPNELAFVKEVIKDPGPPSDSMFTRGAILVPPPVFGRRIGQFRKRLGDRRSPRADPDHLHHRGFPPHRERRSLNTGMILITLDTEYLADEFIPALLTQHISGDHQIPYNFQVKQRFGDGTLITAQGEKEDHWEVEIDFFRLRRLPGLSPILESENDEDEVWEDQRLLNIYAEMARHMYAVAFNSNAGEGEWLLSVNYRSGSIEQLIEKTRFRNLLVSFSVLFLLGGSIGLIFANTRKARQLAHSRLEFVAGISHELLTPLAGIRGAGQNLAAGVISSPERVVQYGEVIEKESDRLSNLVNQVLAFARLQSGQEHFSKQDQPLRPILLAGLEDCQNLFNENQWQCDFSIGENLGCLEADGLAVRRVLQNLVGNALKYAPEGKWLKVSAHREGRFSFVRVWDRGPGIDPGESAAIFKPFYRGKKQVASNVPGSGLGLYLVEHIITAHGGKITLESPKDGGACFVIKLPVHD